MRGLRVPGTMRHLRRLMTGMATAGGVKHHRQGLHCPGPSDSLCLDVSHKVYHVVHSRGMTSTIQAQQAVCHLHGYNAAPFRVKHQSLSSLPAVWRSAMPGHGPALTAPRSRHRKGKRAVVLPPRPLLRPKRKSWGGAQATLTAPVLARQACSAKSLITFNALVKKGIRNVPCMLTSPRCNSEQREMRRAHRATQNPDRAQRGATYLRGTPILATSLPHTKPISLSLPSRLIPSSPHHVVNTV